jgi:hypothetical protein
MTCECGKLYVGQVHAHVPLLHVAVLIVSCKEFDLATALGQHRGCSRPNASANISTKGYPMQVLAQCHHHMATYLAAKRRSHHTPAGHPKAKGILPIQSVWAHRDDMTVATSH